MEDAPLFTAEPNSLPFIVAPASVASLLFTLSSYAFLSPLIRQYLLSTHRGFPKKSITYLDTLLASTVHAILVVILIIYLLATGDLGTYSVFSKSPLGFTILQLSLGYFVGDFIIVLCNATLRDSNNVIHHLSGIAGLGLSLYFQGQMMRLILCRLLSELSTPFVNARWVLHELGVKHSLGYSVVAQGMMATFFCGRIAPMLWHWYEFFRCSMQPGIVIMSMFFRIWALCNFAAFDVLNLIWFYKMIKGAIKFYSKHQK